MNLTSAPGPDSSRSSARSRFSTSRSRTAIVVSGGALAVGLLATTATWALSPGEAETIPTVPVTATVALPTTSVAPADTVAPPTSAPTSKPSTKPAADTKKKTTTTTKKSTTTTKPTAKAPVTTNPTVPTPPAVTYTTATPNGPGALRGDGLGVAKLGEDAEQALGKMVAAWGRPTSDSGWQEWDMDAELRYVAFGDRLFAEFEKRNGTSRFTGAGYTTGGSANSPALATATGVSLAGSKEYTQGDFAPASTPSVTDSRHVGARCIVDHGQNLCARSVGTFTDAGEQLPIAMDEPIWMVMLGEIRFHGGC